MQKASPLKNADKRGFRWSRFFWRWFLGMRAREEERKRVKKADFQGRCIGGTVVPLWLSLLFSFCPPVCFFLYLLVFLVFGLLVVFLFLLREKQSGGSPMRSGR